MTFHYGIRNKKTQEYDYIGTYAPLEGEWISWGTNPDGSTADWDIVGIKWAEIHTDDNQTIGVSEEFLRGMCNNLNVVFRKELAEEVE